MNIDQLEYFITIAKKKNFTLAAQELNVTQSTLSHSMKNLEEKFGVLLFDRTSRKTSLTRFGEILLDYVPTIIALLEEATAKIEDMSNPDAGIIAISYFSSLNPLVTFAVSKYFSTIGKIQPHFRFFPSSTTEIEKAIIDELSDLAFTTEIANPNFEYFRIGHHETVVAVSEKHPLARHDQILLSQLHNQKLITYEDSCQIRGYIDNILAIAEAKPNIIFETTDDNIILSSVSANFGAALIPKPLTSHPGPIKILPIIDEVPPRSIALGWKKNRYQSKAVESFLTFIVNNKENLDDFLRRSM